MNDTHYSEDTLSAWAIEEISTSSPSSRQEPHLESCRLCSEKFRFFLDYYRNLKVEQGQARIPEGLSGENILLLSPFKHNVAAARRMDDTPHLILAAKEMKTLDDRFVELMVYSSTDPPVVLRVIEDRQQSVCKAFLLAESPAFLSGAKLSFLDDTGKAASASTDEHGSALLSMPPGFRWKESHVGITPATLK